MNETLKQLKRIAKKSNGKMRVVNVPSEMRQSAESLKKLENEIAAQREANEAMMNRSYINAGKV